MRRKCLSISSFNTLLSPAYKKTTICPTVSASRFQTHYFLFHNLQNGKEKQDTGNSSQPWSTASTTGSRIEKGSWLFKHLKQVLSLPVMKTWGLFSGFHLGEQSFLIYLRNCSCHSFLAETLQFLTPHKTNSQPNSPIFKQRTVAFHWRNASGELRSMYHISNVHLHSDIAGTILLLKAAG